MALFPIPFIESVYLLHYYSCTLQNATIEYLSESVCVCVCVCVCVLDKLDNGHCQIKVTVGL